MNEEELRYIGHAIEHAGRETPYVPTKDEFENTFGCTLSDEFGTILEVFASLSRIGEPAQTIPELVQGLAVVAPDSVEEMTEIADAINREVVYTEDDDMHTAYLPNLLANNPTGDIYITEEIPDDERLRVIDDINSDNIILIEEDDDEFEEIREIFDVKDAASVSLAPGALKELGVSDATRESILGTSGMFTNFVRTMKYYLSGVWA